MTLINEEDAGWIGRATFASKYFDSVVTFVSKVSILSIPMQKVLKSSCDLSLLDVVCLFLWFIEYKVNCLARGCYILKYISCLK